MDEFKFILIIPLMVQLNPFALQQLFALVSNFIGSLSPYLDTNILFENNVFFLLKAKKSIGIDKNFSRSYGH